MNILYTLNDKFVPQVAAGIASVCENNKELKDIKFYLFSMGITLENKKKLKKMVSNYNRKIEIIELRELNSYFDFKFDTNGWNPIVLARLLIDKILPENIDKILYLDGDTICRGSLESLWMDNMENKVLGASIEPTIDKKRKKELDLENSHYYNAGVLLINLKKWRKENTGKKQYHYFYQ